MYFRLPFIAISILILSACTTLSNKHELASNQLREKLQSSQVVVVPVANPVKLVERTKSKAIGNMLISSLVSSAASSSGHPSNMQQIKNNIEISQNLGKELQQALPDGNVIDSGNGIDLALASKLADYFNNDHTDMNGGSETITVSISADIWELGYESMLTSSDYALNYDLRLSVMEKDGSETQLLKQIVCRGKAPNKMSLEQWKAEDYRKIDAAVPVIVDRCFKTAMTEMGLN